MIIANRLLAAAVIATSLGACAHGSGAASLLERVELSATADEAVNAMAGVTEPQVVATSSGGASWYGPGFHGRLAASGEVFSQNAPTAAHRSLPFGTWVRVTNLANAKSTLVRINDRGPFHGNRIIDLSKKAAIDIDMIRSGTASVRIEVLSHAPTQALAYR